MHHVTNDGAAVEGAVIVYPALHVADCVVALGAEHARYASPLPINQSFV
jgi:hypothetical protein